jgi:serine/threonine-protein kinase
MSEVAGLLHELRRLCEMTPGPERSARVWQTFGRAYGNHDWPQLADFAMGHGLVRHCEDRPPRARHGDERRQFVWVNPVDGSEMVWIPAGPFFIGPKQDKRVAHSAGFSLARHPVTNAQFAQFLAETGYAPPAEHPDPDRFLWRWGDGRDRRGYRTHPVVWVSYLDALAFCDWAGVTLPTEWLWEKAARGPEGPPFPWGEQSPVQPYFGRSPELANVRSHDTRPVGSYPRTRTAYGCEDMIGNVSEWCRVTVGDDFGRVPEDRPISRVPTPDEVVYAAVRGSCFLRTRQERMLAWHRRRLSVTRRNQWVGFRPACLLPFFPA